MPRIIGFTSQQKLAHQKEVLADRCKLLLYESGISQLELAEYLGITPQALCRQFKEKRLRTDTLIAIFSLTNTDESRIKDYMTIK